MWNVKSGIPAAAEDHDGRQTEGEERPGGGLGGLAEGSPQGAKRARTGLSNDCSFYGKNGSS